MKQKRLKRRPPPTRIPCRAQPYLLTRGELSFYHALVQCMGPDYTVFSKVRIRDVLHYPNTATARPHLNRIAQKHVDFVICERYTTRILAALELDDRSHDRKDRKTRDELLNNAFDAASLPLIRIRARSRYDLDILRRVVMRRLNWSVEWEMQLAVPGVIPLRSARRVRHFPKR